MKRPGHTVHEHRSTGPYIAQLAVALVAAVTVLAGFSYATSRMVGRLTSHGASASVGQARLSQSRGASRTGAGWRAASGSRVERHRVAVTLTIDDPTTLRVRVPAGRPLHIRFAGTEPGDPVTFETLRITARGETDGCSAALPPLDSGAYPFATLSGSCAGVLIAE